MNPKLSPTAQVLIFLNCCGGARLLHLRNDSISHSRLQNLRKRRFSNPTRPRNLSAQGTIVVGIGKVGTASVVVDVVVRIVVVIRVVANSFTSVTVLIEMTDVAVGASELGTLDEDLPGLSANVVVCVISIEGRRVVCTVIGADLSTADPKLGTRPDELRKAKEIKKGSCEATRYKHLRVAMV